MAEDLARNSSVPLTVVVSRRVRKGQEAEFEKLSSQMTERASRFPGHLGATMFRPSSPEDPEYRIMFKFRDRQTLDAWEKSEDRAELLEQIESLLLQPSERDVTSGIITWFTLPGQNPVQPPPKWKMTLVSWLALYPAVTLVFILFGDLLTTMPLLLRTMLVTMVVMLLMSYVLMPRMTRWFAFWLFPDRQKNIR
ncbi:MULTISPECIES: antibiotic biosynthesis monooxygenase [Marinobacter]|uniref:Antibiotic biosynthesis monooxygenase n=1 Tax=Marinobacter xiaoshiensis TaxID=3073652 RepID=A0ABU2HCF4_9GAMM|nr:MULTISPECIES: antibiotic biosynthesis monooxygenase [unclassified Marinobacter]MBK1887183.1 antibiotic biosynthesis monooxygenase [Marinobacter sp. DY40_1A1]MDS1308752.1 antibiotic biosynthesis monooxygenase [Marinobacter sp. F60267]